MKLTETATQSSSSVRGASEQNEPSVRKDGRGGGGSRNFGGGPGHSGQSVLFNASSSSILQARVLKRRKRRRLIQRIRLKQIRIPSSIKRVKRVNSDVFFSFSSNSMLVLIAWQNPVWFVSVAANCFRFARGWTPDDVQTWNISFQSARLII